METPYPPPVALPLPEYADRLLRVACLVWLAAHGYGDNSALRFSLAAMQAHNQVKPQ